MSKRHPAGRAEKYRSRRKKLLLKKRSQLPRGMDLEHLEPKMMLTGPQIVGITPNAGELLQDGDTRNRAPQELTFRFDENQVIDEATLGGISIFSFDDGRIIEPGFVGLGERPNEVVLRFAEALQDGSYRIDIRGAGPDALRNVEGEAFNDGVIRSVSFNLDLAPLVTAVVPQPITRAAGGGLTQDRNRIDVYFNDDDLLASSAQQPRFYQLIYTADTVSNADDVVHLPTAVSYDSVTDTAALTFDSDLVDLSAEGTYRLRVGTDETLPAVPVITDLPDDVGDTFATAFDLGTLTRTDQVVTSAIDTVSYPLTFPGGFGEPGRPSFPDIPEDVQDGITIVEYNFQSLIVLEDGSTFFNLITEEQKERAREMVDILSAQAGVQFVETLNSGITVGTATLPGLFPNVVAVPFTFDNDEFGGSWFNEAMRQMIAQLDSEFFAVPDPTFAAEDPTRDFAFIRPVFIDPNLPDPPVIDPLSAEQLYPRNSSVVNLQHAHRPDSTDIDVYQFDLDSRGKLTVDSIAERAGTGLDSTLRIYRDRGRDAVLIAQNDDYFGSDAFLDLELDPGRYFATVASAGLEYDPTDGNGVGGTSQGDYELRFSFQPTVNNSLVDSSGIALDGDADGVAGGVFNYWFQARAAADTIYVDKTASGLGVRGDIAAPFNTIGSALSASQPGDVVRIVGNGGADGNLATTFDNEPYELGFDQFGVALPDGEAMVLPQGVTAMIDEGAIFKLRKSSIQVGSSSVAVDLSGSAIQVLGTPNNSVIFTSFDDETIGTDSNPLPTTPDPGDWGGILVRNDLDRAEGRFDYEQIGAFPNYVNHADIRYGGGRVSIASVERVIAPVHLVDARADVSFNEITLSADAAISVNPDAFEETRFHAIDSLGIDYQSTPFTPDYARFGPDIHNNRLTNNTTNGLFVRINTIASQRLERMTVTGRWDDLDVVHVIPENLIIEGEVGPAFRNADGSLTPRVGAGLKIDPGSIIKLDGSRIEGTLGTHILAEGLEGQSIIFTSLLDDRFGAGGTFDTSSNDTRSPSSGDWGGLFIAPTGSLSVDNAVIAYGGGLARVEGSFAAFNAIEAHQADTRITNSVIEFSGSGRGGQADLDRPGRPDNAKGAIFLRGTSAVIVDNIIRGTEGIESPAINVDVNSLNDDLVTDRGRSTGFLDGIAEFQDNQGSLIRQNRLSDNSINGLEVRGGTVSRGVVMDDTDIVHVMFEAIEVPDFLSQGGVRLESSAEESLVVKLSGDKAGFVGSGSRTGSLDRIGGILQVVGQPGHPVVMTSLYDDTVGAGFDTDGQPLNVTSSFNRPLPTRPADSFQIDINYGPIIRDLPTFREAAELAARIWESILEDPIRVTIDVEFADLGTGTLGTTSNEIARLDFDDVVSELGADAGDRAHEQIASALPFHEQFAEDVILPDDPADPFTISEFMAVPMANAKALGFNENAIPQVASAYDATETLDSTILMNDNFEIWDFDRTDGILPAKYDFTGVLLHEIGHALGFVSAVDDVDAALGNPGGNRVLEINPLDMFRMSPGEGAEDFEGAARNLDPRQIHVLYDGGFFDPVTPRSFGAIDIPRLTVGDVPLSRGEEFGDGAQASHLKDDQLLMGLELGMMDPSGAPGREIPISQVDRQAFDLIGWDVIGGPISGDWRGITLETLAHDGNLGIVLERESTDSSEVGNAIPALAEFIGSLATDLKSGDENNRLGFTVQGLFNNDRDVDVYSFDAEAGTQIWLDIDKTDATLDTVVELIDANGRVLVRSDDSFAEATGESELFITEGLQAKALPVDPTGGQDHWSTNEKDAGFRVFLPGASGTRNTYHLRVRSSSDRLDILSAGESSGVYELQVRLQELDQLPGSTVRFADISYAIDGVRVRGLPGFSPLAGTVAEDGSLNDDLPIPTFAEHNMLTVEPLRQDERFADFEEVVTDDLVRDPLRLVEDPFYPRTTDPTETEFQEPQAVGAISQSRLGSITITGDLENHLNTPEVLLPPDQSFFLQDSNSGELVIPDIDWYEFRVNGPTTLTFDVDYASGIAGPNASIFVYEAFYAFRETREELVAAKLVYSSKDGRDADDVPAPLSGADLDDLGRGSVSSDDPFLGPVPITPTADGRFLVAITAGLEPVDFLQYRVGVPGIDPERDPEAGRGIIEAVPTPNNPFIRFEPVDSVVRVLDDTFEFTDPETTTAAVPHHLGDVPLFISTQTSFSLVNPFTGSNGGQVGSLDIPIGDFDIRAGLGDPVTDDWNFYAYSLGVTPNDADSGNYLVINPEDGSLLSVNDFGGGGGAGGGGGGGGGGNAPQFTDDGLVTSMLVPDADPANPPTLQASDTGVQYQAFEFFSDTIGYAIGHRPDIGVYNILYQFSVPRGDTLGTELEEEFFTMLPPAPGGLSGLTNIAERGVICTDPGDANCDGVADVRDEGTVLSVVSDVVVDGNLMIADGVTITTEDGQVAEINIGPELVLDLNAAEGRHFVDGDTFTANGVRFEVDTGRVLTITDPAAIQDGDTLTITNDSALSPLQVQFEFDLVGDGVAEGNTAIPISGGVNTAQVGGSIVAVINTTDFGVTASIAGDRISLQGDSPTADILISNPDSLAIVGEAGVSANRPFEVEETFNTRQVGEVFTGFFGDEAVVLNDRVVFPGGAADFSQLVDRGIAVASSANSGLASADAIQVDVLPSDSREVVAEKIANAIGAEATGGIVALDSGTFTETSDDAAFTIGGTNPGGRIGGMHFIRGRLYVVTDQGGLYEVPGFAGEAGGRPIRADYIGTSTELAGARFSGLTSGPANIEGGRYANTLFATTSRGEVHAFDTDGVPQPIFANGATSVSTGVGGANGLLFSPADENLWHITDRKGPDPGHGQVTQAGNREFGDLGLSFHFGDANPDLTENRHYNFPGGAHGSLMTDSFDLAGYTAADQPTLYFNYFLATDASNPASESGAVDSFRVFVNDETADEGRGEWVMLGSNQIADVFAGATQLFDNTWEDQPELYPGDPQEPNEDTFILRRNGLRDPYTENRNNLDDQGAPLETPPFPVPSEEATIWRQARLDLSEFAGSSSLRIRFDFSSSGSFGVGSGSGGIELRAVGGDLLTDGDQFVIDGVRFEFDMGLALQAPTGVLIEDGELLLLEGQTATELALQFVKTPTEGTSLFVSPNLRPVDGDRFRLDLGGESSVFTFDDSGTRGDLGIDLGTDSLIDAIAATINGAGLSYSATVQGDLIVLSDADIELNPFASGLLSVTPVAVTDDMAPLDVAAAVADAVNSAGSNVAVVQVDRSLLLQGVQRVDTSADSFFETTGAAGQNTPDAEGIQLVSVDVQMDATEVAAEVAQAVADVFAGGHVDAVKTFENTVYIHDLRVTSPGPLGLASSLPGDIGHLYGPQRVVDNQWQYVIIDEDGAGGGGGNQQDEDEIDETAENFIVPYEGVFVDDIIVGFASRGEQVLDHRLSTAEIASLIPVEDTEEDRIRLLRPQTQRGRNEDFDQLLNDVNGRPPLLPDDNGFFPTEPQEDMIWDGPEILQFVDRSHFLPEPPAFVVDPSFVGSLTGPYQLEIRVASTATVDRLSNGELIDPRERLARSTTLFASPGLALADGQFIELTNGNNTVIFEYEDISIDNGVAPGNIAVPFHVDDPAVVVAGTIRDAINTSAFVRTALGITAAGADGTTVGLPSSNAVQLHGPVIFVQPGSSIEFDLTTADESSNPEAIQGQILVESNNISHSQMFGVVTEDGYRAVPEPGLFDPEGLLVHWPRQVGDYSSGLGSTKDLITPNVSNQLASVVVANNVISRSGAGGIHASGDPGGYIITPPLGGTPLQTEVWDNYPFIFAITDHHGKTVQFEFDVDGALNTVTPTVPVTITTTPDCPLAVDCMPRTDASTDPNMSTELSRVITGSGLDVTVYQHDESLESAMPLFIEGAAEVVGIAVGDSLDSLVLADWFTPWYDKVDGLRTYSRIVNNTIVGSGGVQTDNTTIEVDVFNPRPGEDSIKDVLINDTTDAGILIDDFAFPTLINNITVNLEAGIQADLSANDSVVGGTLFQNNVENTDNINVGDFPIVLGPNDPLFVDVDTDNFYLSPLTRAIDSSIDSLEDRPSFVSVKEPVGIPRSNVLSPERDVLGQLREDDPNVETPSGLGQNVFKDRGAIDRVDFVGPTVSLVNPRDNDQAGIDKNSAPTIVSLESTVLTNFRLQFSDSAGVGEGTGIDHNTVTSSSVSILQDGRLLQEGLDYTFRYDATNSVIRLTPLAGVWQNGSTYNLRFSPDIRDVAGNVIQPNQVSGATTFTISTAAGSDYGDAPLPYPTLLGDNGPLHNLVPGFFLGNGATQDEDGQPNANAAGDGADDGLTAPDLLERDTPNIISVQASGDGLLDAWLDFNQDGDWDDAGEQIFVSEQLSAGANSLVVSVPTDALSGDTYARFRFSSSGGLAPTGAATDGEVEDYLVSIHPGSIYQNSDNPLDVSADGSISAVDVLRIIQEIDDPKGSDPTSAELFVPAVVPNTPETIGFVDVNGDGFVSARDAQMVVVAINANGDSGGEPIVDLFASDTVDPIGEILKNPVVELPRAAAPLPAVLDALVSDDEDLALDLAERSDSSFDQLFADLDWIDG